MIIIVAADPTSRVASDVVVARRRRSVDSILHNIPRVSPARVSVFFASRRSAGHTHVASTPTYKKRNPSRTLSQQCRTRIHKHGETSRGPRFCGPSRREDRVVHDRHEPDRRGQCYDTRRPVRRRCVNRLGGPQHPDRDHKPNIPTGRREPDIPDQARHPGGREVASRVTASDARGRHEKGPTIRHRRNRGLHPGDIPRQQRPRGAGDPPAFPGHRSENRRLREERPIRLLIHGNRRTAR